MMSEAQAAHRAAFFWLGAAALALGAYAWINDPLRFALLRLVPLAFAALFVAACTGYGLIARATDLLTAAAIGIGIVGTLGFVSALTHLAYQTTFALVIVVGLVLLVVRALNPERSEGSPAHLRLWVGDPSQRSGFVPLTIIAIVLVVIIPYVAAPDVSTDGLEYHLLIPQTILAQNAIAYMPHFVESNYPSIGEYLFLPLLSLMDDRAAKAFHFLCAILVLFAIARLARTNKALAAALFFAMPVVVLTAGWAWNDMLFTLFVLLTLVHLNERRFLLAGVMFGFATWTKYTFVLVSFGIAAVLIRGVVQRWWRWSDVVRFAAPVLGIAAIWMTKNAVLTGNPVYPFLNSIFASPFWSEVSDLYLRTTLTRFEIPVWHWWTYVAFPFLLTLKPRIIDVHPGVLPLLLLPLAFGRKRDDETSVLRTYAIGIVVGWLLIRTEMRSLLSLLAVLSALYASRIDEVRGWRWIVGAGVALNLIIILVSTHHITSPTRFFLGLETAQQYVLREDPKQGAYDWLNRQPNVGGVLLVGLHDPYYLRKPVLFSSCCDTPIAQAVDVEKLKASGVTHIAFRGHEFAKDHEHRLYSWTPQQRETFLRFLRERCRPVTRIGDVLILELS